MIASDEGSFGSFATAVFHGSGASNRPPLVEPPEPVDEELDVDVTLLELVLDAVEEDVVEAPPVDEVDVPAPPVPVVDPAPPAPPEPVVAPLDAAVELACEEVGWWQC